MYLTKIGNYFMAGFTALTLNGFGNIKITARINGFDINDAALSVLI